MNTVLYFSDPLRLFALWRICWTLTEFDRVTLVGLDVLLSFRRPSLTASCLGFLPSSSKIAVTFSWSCSSSSSSSQNTIKFLLLSSSATTCFTTVFRDSWFRTAPSEGRVDTDLTAFTASLYDFTTADSTDNWTDYLISATWVFFAAISSSWSLMTDDWQLMVSAIRFREFCCNSLIKVSCWYTSFIPSNNILERLSFDTDLILKQSLLDIPSGWLAPGTWAIQFLHQNSAIFSTWLSCFTSSVILHYTRRTGNSQDKVRLLSCYNLW